MQKLNKNKERKGAWQYKKGKYKKKTLILREKS